MASHTEYRLNRHHKFEHGGQKYVADLQTNDIIQLSDVEWEILDHYETQTRYQLVEQMKQKYKIATIFEGIERLERLGERGTLLRRIDRAAGKTPHSGEPGDRTPQVLVPFHFTKENASLDYTTRLNRYQLLKHLTALAELETLTFSQAGKAHRKPEDFQNVGEMRVRHIEVEEHSAFAPPWYAMGRHDGILLLSQFLKDDLLYYRGAGVPIVHVIDDVQESQDLARETLLNICNFQDTNDTLVVRSSWVKAWLEERATPGGCLRVIPNGINVGEPIGKPLAKQHTAALFGKSIFAQQPVVGLISGFDPNEGAKLIAAFAHTHPHLAIFVYDPFLASHWTQPPDNVVIFRADDEETHSVLPIFFQALDLVCFPAVPGTPLSLILEAMAYGSPCIAITKYGLPPEVAGAGTVVEAQGNNAGTLRVEMSELSDTVNAWLRPSRRRTAAEAVAKSLVQTFTWEKAAQALIELFKDRTLHHRNLYPTQTPLFPSIFCRHYDPGTWTTGLSVYRLGVNRYDCLKTALVEMLAAQHTPTEIDTVLKYLGWDREASA